MSVNWFKSFRTALTTPADREAGFSNFTPHAKQVLVLARKEDERHSTPREIIVVFQTGGGIIGPN